MEKLHFFIACEDQLAKALCIKLINYALPNATYNEPIVTGGCGELKKKIEPFIKISSKNELATLLLTDLDQISSVQILKETWLNKLKIPERFFLHVCVREAESWVLADADGFSHWALIPKSKIPRIPDEENNIKEKLIYIFKKYSNSKFSADIVPSVNSKNTKVGVGYNARLIEFVDHYWNIENALVNSPSLRNSVNELKKLLI
ncbi:MULTISPECIES: DUF4276 family protein [Acinetobacter]|uniref:DUF4276 family protein n=1 Tax=Acinetobacter TaxID=469 RepID=UPI001905354B|nr:DUF4276 family protein [Acinetobacter sp. TGL-Y2]MBJ9371214.1 DUF4276 family protein [Acinetobacter sp. TGL-Y2]